MKMNRTAAKRRGEGLVVFRGLLPEIRAAIEAGWTMKAIYDQFEDQLKVVRYRQFSEYVNRFFGNLRDEVRGTKRARKENEATPAAAKPSAFRFDPNGATSKKLV